MLTLTPAAAEVVRLIIADAPFEDGGGLRIARGDATEEGTALEMTLVDSPEEDDEAVESDGGTLFLEPQAAELLNDKVLHAELDDGEVRFAVIDPQDSTPTRNGFGPG
jgi:Fe-S cluster assembly iron-binding protein IscA